MDSLVYLIAKMKTPREFAERYIKREIYLPFMLNMSGLLYLPDIFTVSRLEKIYKTSYKNNIFSLKKTKLDSLESCNINADAKEKIYTALHELIQAMTLDLEILKKLNRDFVKKRKDTIRNLEETLKNTLPVKRQALEEELKRLRAFDSRKRPYKEIDFISSWHHVFYTGLMKKLVLKIEINKLLEMLSIPLDFKKRRLQKYFFKVFQIVVFRYLHEHAKIPKEKAKNLAVEVINEYILKKGYKGIAHLNSRDVYNKRG